MIGDDAGVAGFVTISAWNAGAEASRLHAPETRSTMERDFAEDLRFTNMSFTSMAAEIVAHAKAWDWTKNTAEMVGHPVLVIDADDGLAPTGDAVVATVTAAGGPVPTRLRFATDHSYNDHRIALASAILVWLQAHFPQP
ncbi:hypothetical protein [Sphingomonas sp. Leaf25]|uniref:hypothetical protein n=1 Tax=Sphingomonas sp. Leaf25 TaxID=1735692 RepID=UPI0006FB6245|nr:hypothetical protein [Sphingomonas sp. Leaf25]KQN06688.1 hypothetical protein ASE78_15275 [Sphingomonas sp. Leaf25]